MRILKSETARFIAIGFFGGAALLLAMMGMDSGATLDNSIVPVAHAIATK